MRKELTGFLLSVMLLPLVAQDNCNVFLWEGDTAKYTACTYLENAPRRYQLTFAHHAIRDSAIRIAPHYDYPYWSKSIAFLKTGDFLNWKILIDQAVERNEIKHLGYRGWCRFQFFRDYEGAISDLERLEDIMGMSDIGICQNGMYHLQVAKALCYKLIGNPEEAIALIERQIAADPDYVGAYDYLHLGVLYLEAGELDKARLNLEKQEAMNPLAENAYYQAMVSESTGDKGRAITLLEESLNRYDQGYYMYDPYTHQVDKVFRVEIEEAYSRMQ